MLPLGFNLQRLGTGTKTLCKRSLSQAQWSSHCTYMRVDLEDYELMHAKIFLLQNHPQFSVKIGIAKESRGT